MYTFLSLFLIYSFLGWCVEVSFAALTSGRFVNRGFLNGPLCPIYGFGVVLVLYCLDPLKEHLLPLFFGSMVLTSLLEWITGFLLEKLFHQRWWDYSNEPFHLGGYICLRFSILWGLACVFVVRLVHPTVKLLLRMVPTAVGWLVLAVSALLLLVDLLATVSAVNRLNRRLTQIDEFAAKIREASDELGENLAERVLEAAEHGADFKEELEEYLAGKALEAAERGTDLREELDIRKARMQVQSARRRAELLAELTEKKARLQAALDTDSFVQHRLMKAFPGMRSTDHAQALEHLRRRMEHRHRARTGKKSQDPGNK